MVEKENTDGVSTGDSALCSACEMMVFWVQNQLKHQETKDKVLNYVNAVII